MNGIVHKYPATRLSSFKGDASYAGCDVMRWDNDPNPTLGDVRHAVRDSCVLPMLSDQIHQAGPPVRSVLVAGAHGSGKHALVNAVCTELGATLFDLTSANIVGKYPGKSGLTMLLHLINKVARSCYITFYYEYSLHRGTGLLLPFLRSVTLMCLCYVVCRHIIKDIYLYSSMGVQEAQLLRSCRFMEVPIEIMKNNF